MVKVRCIIMQKNETYLFGIENLYILDNGSVEETISRLNFYQKLGCNIIYNFNTKQDFENKGFIISSIIQEWDQKSNYDFVFPLDIDGFLIWYMDYPTCNREKNLNYFDGS